MGQQQLYMDKLSLEPAWVWQDDAACAFRDPSLFELIDQHHPLGKGVGYNQLKILNSKNYEEAAKICSSCPVLAECTEAAEPDDWKWNFRAGRMPLLFSENPQGRPKHASRYVDGKCKNGHDEIEGNVQCMECKRESSRAHYARIKSGEHVVVPRSAKKRDPLDPRTAHRVD